MSKSKTWTFILYPEDDGYSELLGYLKQNNFDGIRGYYITHKPMPKKDKETGEVIEVDGVVQYTKEHTHFVIQFPNQRSQLGVCKALGFPPPEKKTKKVKKTEKQFNKNGELVKTSEKEIEVDEKTRTEVLTESEENIHRSMQVFSVSDSTSMYYYCLHWTIACQRQHKERYEYYDIKPLGNDSVDYILSCRGERELTARVTCAELLQKAESASCARELLMNCIDDEHHVKFIMKNPFFVKSFILREEQRK